VSGEAFGLLPLGELARAEVCSEATGAALGTSIAAVTVQEMLYTTVIVAVAIPGALAYTAGISGIAASLAGILAILGVLTVPPVFRAVVGLVRGVPLLRRATTQLEVLHEQTVRLLRRPETWLWATLSLLGALFELTLFWLMVWGTTGMTVPWVTTTFIYGAAYLTGAVASPIGGVGGFESAAIALLGTQGVLGPAAVAAVLLLRAADKGVITTVGFGCWLWVRRHIHARTGLLLGDGDVSVVAAGIGAAAVDAQTEVGTEPVAEPAQSGGTLTRPRWPLALPHPLVPVPVRVEPALARSVGGVSSSG